MLTEQLLDELRQQGELLVTSASRAGLQQPVPSCPGWTVARALGHTARVYRWAAWIVRGGDSAAFSYDRPKDEDLEADFRAGLADVLQALRKAPDNLQVHTLFPAPSAKVFWARRQAHETAIHRVDVELAAGYGVTEFDVEFAADGIDELLTGMLGGAFSDAGVTAPRTVSITPLDINQAWTVRIAPGSVASRAGADDGADLSVFGMASELYQWVWNRLPDHEVSLRGDLTLADLWHQNFRVGARPA